MTFDEIYETIPGNGWLTKPEAELLWHTAKERSGPILEIGCYQGRSTVLLASLGRPVYSVDPFDNFDTGLSGDAVQALFLGNLLERGITNVIQFRQKIEDWNWKSLSIGFAYLDGDHTCAGTMAQIAKAVACGATAMCIHDYAQSGGGLEVVKAIQAARLDVVSIVERMAFCKVKPLNESMQ